MAAVVMDGKALAAKIKDQVRLQVERMERKPGMATVLVGEDPAAQVYEAGKRRDCQQCGIYYETYRLPEDVPQAAPGVTAERKATGVAKSFDKKLAGTYAVTAGSGLHIRNVAGSKTGSMVVLPCGTKVQNYGYYTEVNGVKWLYIQVTYQCVKYTGFSSGAYLCRI